MVAGEPFWPWDDGPLRCRRRRTASHGEQGRFPDGTPLYGCARCCRDFASLERTCSRLRAAEEADLGSEAALVCPPVPAFVMATQRR
jgi:hypothetical protein